MVNRSLSIVVTATLGLVLLAGPALAAVPPPQGPLAAVLGHNPVPVPGSVDVVPGCWAAPPRIGWAPGATGTTWVASSSGVECSRVGQYRVTRAFLEIQWQNTTGFWSVVATVEVQPPSTPRAFTASCGPVAGHCLYFARIRPHRAVVAYEFTNVTSGAVTTVTQGGPVQPALR